MATSTIPDAQYTLADAGLTKPEAASKFECSVFTIERWIRRGDLRTKKIGGTVYVTHESIKNLILNGR